MFCRNVTHLCDTKNNFKIVLTLVIAEEMSSSFLMQKMKLFSIANEGAAWTDLLTWSAQRMFEREDGKAYE